MKKIIFILFLFLTACGMPTATSSTVDPFVAVESAQRTAAAAQDQADFYGSQLTATAEAPIVAITQTAAAFAMNQQYAQATSQASQMTQTAALTQTAQSWTPTPVPTSTPNLTATMAVLELSATAQVMSNEVVKDNLSVERAKSTNMLYAAAPYLVGFAVLVLVLIFAYVAVQRFAHVATQIHDLTGKPRPLLNVLDGVVVDIDRSPNGAMQLRKGYLNQLPAITSDRQDAVTNRAQLVDLQTRRSRLPKQLVERQAITNTNEAMLSASAEHLFPLPAWDLVKGWNQDQNMLPLGNSDKGMEYWDLNIHAHLAVFGMTRSGKDRRLLRPLIAFILASKQRVISLGKESDYLPFMDHPNAKFVPVYDITERGEAMKYFQALEACVEEKNRRIQMMAKHGVSTWQWERTFIILGELGNALLEMDTDLANLTMKKTRSMVNEAAKAGMSLIFSAQRPKGFVDLITQCGRVTFQVENEQELNYALGMKSAGLPVIPTGYFYKKMRGVQITGGFEPSDEELRAYLSAQQTPALPPVQWIEAVIKPTEQKQIEHKTETESLPEAQPIVVDEITQLAETIRERWNDGMSGRQTAELLGFSQYGGSYKAKTDKVMALLRGSTTTSATTTENTGNLANLEPIAA